MIHRIGLAGAALMIVLAGLCLAGDPPAAGSRGDERPARLKKKDRPPLPVPGKGDLDKKPVPEDQPPIDEAREEKLRGDGEPEQPEAGEQAGAVMERIGKNMRVAEERLQRKELGDGLKAVQDDIVNDLDSLIRHQQQQKQQSADGGGQEQKNQQQAKGQQQQKNQQQKNQQASGSSQGSGSGQQQRIARGMRNQPRQQQKGSGQGSGQIAKNNNKPPKAGQPGSRPMPPQGEGNKGGDPNTLADVFKDTWGHLPLADRAEMDSYGREKFMTKYETMLRQYYSTLSEKSRSRGSDEK